jgi:hypothetical protein
MLEMPYLILRLLRVFALPGDRLAFNHRVGAYQPTSEAWWRDVLSDPRAELPVERDIPAGSPNGRYRLDRYPHAELRWRCPACNHVCIPADRDKFIQAMGPETNVVWAVRTISGCRHRNKVGNMCQAIPIL